MPEEDIDPRNWRTELDDFDHRGKYWYREPSQFSMQRVVGRAVVARLCRLIGEHPLLNAMTASSQFPGTTGAWFLRGKPCQQSAANQLGLSLAPHCVASTPFRTEAKSLDPAQRRAVIAGCSAASSTCRTCGRIIDDIYCSGTTVAEVARAACAAGAVEIASLCAVRTKRSV